MSFRWPRRGGAGNTSRAGNIHRAPPNAAKYGGIDGLRSSRDEQPRVIQKVDLIEDEDSAPDAPRHCTCDGKPVALQKASATVTNPGRLFWVCARPRGEQCGFFEWDDTPSRAQSSSHVVPVGQPSPKRPRLGSGVCFSAVAINRVAASILKTVFPDDSLVTLRACPGVTVKEGAADVLGDALVKVTVDLREFSKIQAMFEKLGIAVNCDLPPNVRARFAEYLQKEDQRMQTRTPVTRSLDEILPSVMCEKLMQFQWEGIQFALLRDGRCLIGDDMGLGKTLQAIAVARIYRDDWPLLIICPSSLRLNWKEELLKWLGEDISPEDINVVMKGADCLKRLEIVNIVSYELVQKIPERGLARCKFVVADESHYLKSRDTKRTRFVIPLITTARRALLLSGTPALSRPIELFPQVSALEPSLFPDYRDYAERYCNAHMGRWGWDVSGSSCLDELHMALSGSCLIRRKKGDVLTQLPAKQRGVVWVETKPSVMKKVATAQKEYEGAKIASDNATGDDADSCRNAMRAAMNKLYTLTGEAKVEAVQQFLKDSLESTQKIIVFGHHQEVLASIDEFVRSKLKVRTIVIDGKTPQLSRQGLCKTFQTEKECRVAVLSITAAGVGLTLTAASMVVFAELYWNPGSLLQAEDRAHRIGQKDSVLVQYLLARGTLDESMWSTVRKKLMVVGKSLTGSAVAMNVDNSDSNLDGPMDKFRNRSGEEIEDGGTRKAPCVVLDSEDDGDSKPIRKPNRRGEGALRQKASDGHCGDDPDRASCEVVELGSDEDMFPTDIRDGKVRRQERRVHYDADLAYARRLHRRVNRSD